MFPAIDTRSHIVVRDPSYGRSPAGFVRMHIELRPKEAIRLIGYDPRVLQQGRPGKGGAKRPKVLPHNVSEAIISLQNSVQRSIDTKRVADMVEYLRSAFEMGTFADFGTIELVTTSEPQPHEGVAWLDPDADYFLGDGQHRYCALLDFVHQYPQYADRFTQGLTINILPEERLIEWAGQFFHDRNYFAVAVRAGKALSVDTRDPVNTVAKALDAHPDIKRAGGVAYERDTLLQGDPRFTTHSVLHRFVRGFLFGRSGIDKGDGLGAQVGDEMRTNLWEYISALALILPWFTEDRELYLTRSSVVLTALSVVGHDLYTRGMHTDDIVKRIYTLSRVDWKRTNMGLAGIVGTEKEVKNKETGEVTHVVQPASSRQAIDATIRFLREKMGLLSPSN